MTTTTPLLLTPKIRQKGVDTINSSQLYHHWHTNYDKFLSLFFVFYFILFSFYVMRMSLITVKTVYYLNVLLIDARAWQRKRVAFWLDRHTEIIAFPFFYNFSRSIWYAYAISLRLINWKRRVICLNCCTDDVKQLTSNLSHKYYIWNSKESECVCLLIHARFFSVVQTKTNFQNAISVWFMCLRGVHFLSSHRYQAFHYCMAVLYRMNYEHEWLSYAKLSPALFFGSLTYN